jgi:hypothetical protein
VRGYMVLSDAPISLNSLSPRLRRRFELQFRAVGRSVRPNACFTLVGHPHRKSIAAAESVGFTSWGGDDSSAELTFYRAPDSGYDVSLLLSQGSVRGAGHFFSANGPGANCESFEAAGILLGAIGKRNTAGRSPLANRAS